ncbi:Crp/Fnr family transcriptional regulator [Ichthyenterobacterium magnum]|uniref:CRP-like cAMP-binding protein n=1 Tax=Ichthyenterobacterium magnum TaxID=1230530 RepID=A0A420DUE4_9FLAO|nr:Crp/Fnr family transcriptional regulator [Ichthyenterobacterium magnum]RKE97944.1 CRP-like cAMP-binding protein [Ichthyenterobacterium magnum]
MKNQLKTYLNRYVYFSDTEIDLIYSQLKEKTFKKKAFLLKESKVCKFNYFILKGLVRSFYIDEKGKEKITLFAIDNWWVTNTESFIKQTPSIQYIQAIEETTVLYLSKETLEILYNKCPKLERAFRIITENMLIANQRKSDVFLQMKSKERYNDFVKKLPDFIQRVPQYMIASYLEISPEYLSELRKPK